MHNYSFKQTFKQHKTIPVNQRLHFTYSLLVPKWIITFIVIISVDVNDNNKGEEYLNQNHVASI